MGITDTSPNVTPILLLNIRGLLQLSNRSKIPYLRDLATCNQAMCMALTETHLTSNISDAELHIPNYVIYRTDRKERSHGGVAMYIREDITVTVLLSHSNSVCDTLMVHIRQLDVVICTTYRPPDAPNHNGKFEDSLSKIEEAFAKLDQHTNILLLGDFNLPNVKWPEGHLLAGMSLHEQRHTKSLLDLSHKLFMEQVILHPTRGSNIMDLCFTNNIELIHNVKVTPTIFSDHNIVELTMYGPKETADTHPTRSSQTLSSLNFHKANWKAIQKEILRQDWPESLPHKSMTQNLINLCQ